MGNHVNNLKSALQSKCSVTVSYLLFFSSKLSYPITWLMAAEWEVLLRLLTPRFEVLRSLFNHFCGNLTPYFYSPELEASIQFPCSPFLLPAPHHGLLCCPLNNDHIVTPLLATEGSHQVKIFKPPLLISSLLQLALLQPWAPRLSPLVHVAASCLVLCL